MDCHCCCGGGGGDAVAAAGQRRGRGVVRVRGHRHPRLHVPRHGHPRALSPAPGPRARACHWRPPPPTPPRRPRRRARRGSRGGKEARQPRAHRDACLRQSCLSADARTRRTNIHRASRPSTLPSREDPVALASAASSFHWFLLVEPKV